MKKWQCFTYFLCFDFFVFLLNQLTVLGKGVSRGRVCGCGCWRWWHVTGDRWHMTGESWQLTGDSWQVERLSLHLVLFELLNTSWLVVNLVLTQIMHFWDWTYSCLHHSRIVHHHFIEPLPCTTVLYFTVLFCTVLPLTSCFVLSFLIDYFPTFS